MTVEGKNESEALRLEALWQGEFGEQYTERNSDAGSSRQAFWRRILQEFPSERILEVGCNAGANLLQISTLTAPTGVFGVDVNESALRTLRERNQDVNVNWAKGRALPFRDAWFDMVFTTGVLIHQPESSLPLVMSEIVRCSRRFVLCGEYAADKTEEVAYRGETGALFRRDYRKLYEELFPELQLRQEGFLDEADGFDRVTYYVFEKV